MRRLPALGAGCWSAPQLPVAKGSALAIHVGGGGAHAEVGFEACDVFADASRRQAQHARCCGETAVLRRLYKGRQMLKVSHAPILKLWLKLITLDLG